MSKVAEGLLYSETHEWVRLDGNVAIIGVSDFAQAEMGDITYVDMPDEDDNVYSGEEFGALESVKASSELFSPVTGKVISRNIELENKPELVNEDPYSAWIIKVEMANTSELDSLMSPSAYTAFIEK